MAFLEKSTPEQAGIASSAILNFVHEIEAVTPGFHSFILLRHSKIVAEGWWSPYLENDQHIMYSVSKSFTSTGVGFAISEGKLKLTDQVISFFPDELPETINENLAAMQVQHLLSMSGGYIADTMQGIDKHPESSWARGILAESVVHQPGTHFLYNTGGTYLLSAIVQKVTGSNLLDYLQPRLFTPLGIENPSWEFNPDGVVTGGFGLNITTNELARFGQLYLQKGVWQGKQLLPAGWVEEASASHVSNGTNPTSDWAQGYGYQFWRCQHGAYRGDGAFGQYCVIMPEQDAVLVITAALPDMQLPLNAVWKHLLPAMQSEALPANPSAAQALAAKLDSLGLPVVKSVVDSSLAREISGKTFVIEPNDYRVKSVTLDFEGEDCVFTLGETNRTSQFSCGNGRWLTSTATLLSSAQRKLAASGGWLANDQYKIQLYSLTLLEQNPTSGALAGVPFDLTLTFQFEGNKVTMGAEIKQSFNRINVQLVGVAE